MYSDSDKGPLTQKGQIMSKLFQQEQMCFECEYAAVVVPCTCFAVTD